MTNESLLKAPDRSGWRALLGRAQHAMARASLRVSPRPMAHLIRKQWEESVGPRAALQLRDAPRDVSEILDERYEAHRDARLDVYVPTSAAATGERLPTVVWIHGGAFVGGSKEELGGYLRRLAAAGFTVVGVGYSLAPDERYPTPVRQVMAALRFLKDHAARLHVDARRFVLVGDSAGAQISAQVAALVTRAEYAAEVGVEATIDPEQLRGVALCCGIFDLAKPVEASPLRELLVTAGWAYSGHRHFRHDEHFISTVSVPGHLDAKFPPTFVTAGNADPLASQSKTFAGALLAHGVEVETLFYPPDHRPPLWHEYQFDLDLEEARAALAHLVVFLERCTESAAE